MGEYIYHVLQYHPKDKLVVQLASQLDMSLDPSPVNQAAQEEIVTATVTSGGQVIFDVPYTEPDFDDAFSEVAYETEIVTEKPPATKKTKKPPVKESKKTKPVE